MRKARNPWLLTVWAIHLNGIPHDWKSSRAAAFQRAAAYRREHPHSTWTVKRCSARLLLIKAESHA